MALPKQTTDIASDRVASAPYNFVPLPEKVVAAATDPEELPRHDRYDPGRLSGYFDVHLTTRSPLYVRGALPLEDFLQAERGVSVDDLEEEGATFRDLPGNTPDFFYQSDPESPVIPGSSLRGMLRFYLSIVSYGKLQPVSERRLSFRSLGASKVGRKYKRITGYGDAVETGFLQERGGEYKIQPCEAVRVSIEDHSLTALYDGNVPCWESPSGTDYHQHASVNVRNTHETEDISPPRMNKKITVEKWEMGTEGRRGCLVLAGSFGDQKEFEHVFLFPEAVEDDDSSLIDVDASLVKDFNSEEQLTRFEREAFPEDKPSEGARQRAGALRRDLQPRPDDEYYGEPVYYTADDGGSSVRFFGRSVLFRLPYEHSPRESLPRAHSDASIYDYPEALFGFVRTGDVYKDFRDRVGTEDGWEKRAEYYEQGRRGRAYAGRVTVTPAATVPGQDKVLAERPIVPKILSTPEPTTVQHYLVQTSDRKENIKTYDDAGGYDNTCEDGSDPETTLRGHKLYWHQGRVSPGKVKEPDADELDCDESQYTYVRPVTPETRFRFRVRFDNLSEAELGALCWALRPEGDPDVMHEPPADVNAPDLSEKELPETGYFHKLGMGRPLGLGSVQLDARLHLTDRTGGHTGRYRALFTETDDSGECRWHDATRRATEEDRADFREAFEEDLRGQLDGEGWWTGGSQAPLRKQCRIQDLLTLMRWPGFPAEKPTRHDPKRYLRDEHRPNTRYMQIELEEHGGEDEFDERPVLPPPATFDGRTHITESKTDDKPASSTEVHPKPCDMADTNKRILGRVEAWIQKQGRPDFGFIKNPNGTGDQDAPPRLQDLYFNEYDKASPDEVITEGGLVSFTVDPPPNEGQSFRARDVRAET